MKRIILALTALALAFAISSCCDKNGRRCKKSREKCESVAAEEVPEGKPAQRACPPTERQHHNRW